MIDIQPIVTWAAPIASTILTTYVLALINRGEKKRDEARAETEANRAREAEWRDSIEAKIEDQDKKIDAVLKGQTTQMRSDIIHRAHRYIDDLGCASTEEKNAFDAEYKDYCAICAAYKIKNNFVDGIARQVMELPSRSSRSDE